MSGETNDGFSHWPSAAKETTSENQAGPLLGAHLKAIQPSFQLWPEIPIVLMIEAMGL